MRFDETRNYVPGSRLGLNSQYSGSEHPTDVLLDLAGSLEALTSLLAWPDESGGVNNFGQMNWELRQQLLALADRLAGEIHEQVCLQNFGNRRTSPQRGRPAAAEHERSSQPPLQP